MPERTFFVLPFSKGNEYNVPYRRVISGRLTDTNVSIMDASDKNIAEELAQEYIEQYKDDPTFKLLSVSNDRFDLSDRVKAVREMFELGHKVRAETKIRNRQPLRKAYILFSDPKIQSFMQYIDCGKQEYADMFVRELNIFNVEFVSGGLAKFFTYLLKPNFRMLGQKGLGKQAQQLKKDLFEMALEDRAELWDKLSKHPVEIFGMTLTVDDIEVEYLPKPGYMGANGKVGSIILDTVVDDMLAEYGTVADFKSSMQNVRKVAKLDLLDRIDIRVFCGKHLAGIIEKNRGKLKKDLLADSITIYSGLDPQLINADLAHKFTVDNEEVSVYLYGGIK